MNFVIRFDTHGNGHCLYTEKINLRELGALKITRATNIEFNNQTAKWEVKDSKNQLLFHHSSRNVCLEWEQRHFNQ